MQVLCFIQAFPFHTAPPHGWYSYAAPSHSRASSVAAAVAVRSNCANEGLEMRMKMKWHA